MCAPIDQPPATLADAIGRAHCWSEDALNTPGRSVLSRVWWLSTHLTAADRVVHPVAVEALPDGGPLVAGQRRRPGEIVRLLWTLVHTASGDARMHGPVSGVVRRLA